MPNKKGLLLIEVLVAIATLAFGLIYVLRAFSSCLKAVSQVNNYNLAMLLAEEKIYEVRTNQGRPEAFAKSGDFSGHPGFSYTLEISKLNDPDINSVCLTVYWQEGKRTGSFDLYTYLPADK